MDAPQTGAGIEIGTVVLVLLVAAMIWLGRALGKLRTEVQDLRATLRAKDHPVPAGLPMEAPVVAPAPVAPAAPTGPSSAEIAAIAIAVHYLLGPRARLVAVGSVESSGQQAWSREGRRQVFQSHQLR